MSTKKIREALAQIDLDHPNAPAGLAVLVTHAVAEVEAIERAAKALDDNEVRRAVRHAPSEVHEAMNLLASIAKEEP